MARVRACVRVCVCVCVCGWGCACERACALACAPAEQVGRQKHTGSAYIQPLNNLPFTPWPRWCSYITPPGTGFLPRETALHHQVTRSPRTTAAVPGRQRSTSRPGPIPGCRAGGWNGHRLGPGSAARQQLPGNGPSCCTTLLSSSGDLAPHIAATRRTWLRRTLPTLLPPPARGLQAWVLPLVDQALKEAGITKDQVDVIAYTKVGRGAGDPPHAPHRAHAFCAHNWPFSMHAELLLTSVRVACAGP